MAKLSYEELLKENESLKNQNARLKYLVNDRDAEIEYYSFVYNIIYTFVDFGLYDYLDLKQKGKTDREIKSILFLDN